MAVYTVEELARELSLSNNDTKKLLKAGEIEGYHMGNRWYVTESWLLRYFTNSSTPMKMRQESS